MEYSYLPGKICDRIQGLMKFNKVTQIELAACVGVSESSLSHVFSSKTGKLGDENIIRIARVFVVGAAVVVLRACGCVAAAGFIYLLLPR